MKYSRSGFIRSIISIGALSQIPILLHSCSNNYIINKKKLPETNIIEKDLLLILRDVQNILFPADTNGPSAADVNAEFHFVNTLEDKRRDPDENQYLTDGIKWLEDSAKETFNKSFLKLKSSDKKKLIEAISKVKWGRTWLSVNITIIVEALLSDPIYTYNVDEIGWKWLNHKAGRPRPTEKLKYDEIFETLNF